MQKFANIITTTNGFQVLCSIKQADEDSGYVSSFETNINKEDLMTVEMKLSIKEGYEEDVLKKILAMTDQDADNIRNSVLEILTDDSVGKKLGISPDPS